MAYHKGPKDREGIVTTLDVVLACAPKPHDYPRSRTEYIEDCAIAWEEFRVSKYDFRPWLEPVPATYVPARTPIQEAHGIAAAASREDLSTSVGATLSARFWFTATILASLVSALLGTFVWQLAFAFLTDNWVTRWPVLLWGIGLSLGLLVTIAAGIRLRITAQQ